MRGYIRDGREIYRRSVAIIRREADFSGLPTDLEPVAVRIAHASGMVDIIADLAFSQHAGEAGRRALESGSPILCDCRMVAAGISRARLPANNAVACMLDDPAVSEIARRLATTRSAAAVELWRTHLADSVAVIGNAPTALFHLLEMLRGGAPKPALIIGFPVGFVGAAEAKQELIEDSRGVPFIAIRGRRGGSAMAAAAVNALAAQSP
jgi:precorrin-8X/cobalt-precorrin-8 methylmutase